MSNIAKNLLLALTVVCIIALIVFCIQLIVINRGVDPARPGTTTPGGSQQGSGEADPDGDGDEPSGDENGPGEGDPGPIQRPPPQGRRHNLRVTPGSVLIIYAREELFDFDERELDWWFLYTYGFATLEISFTMIGPQGAAEHAETFLNAYTGGTEAEFSGEQSIAGSELKGYHVIARHGNEVYEAWIHDLADSDLALVFVINYEGEQERDALYEVLSTLDMENAFGDNTGGIDPGETGQDTGNDPGEDDPELGTDPRLPNP